MAPRGRNDDYDHLRYATGCPPADLREVEQRLKAWVASMLFLQAGLVAALVKLL
ncbi:MAG: hypothetical protein M3436_13640 [Pseudomonadota bacterium]|nr:hypothetical protein [Pseudomonadota bacterium]